MKYGYVGLVLNEYQDWTIPCTKKTDYVTFNGQKNYCLNGDDWASKYYYEKYNVDYCESFLMPASVKLIIIIIY
jgi:hypothetical protein